MVSSEATVLSDRHGQHIAISTIDRPYARNAIHGDVAQARNADPRHQTIRDFWRRDARRTSWR